MAEYHIFNIIPAPDALGMVHGLHGHAEVIETVSWGLAELGHSVTTATGSCRQDCTNIVFGAQVLEREWLTQLPAGTIIYNLEQLAHLEPAQIRQSLHYIASHFQIWDYDARNLEAWRLLQSTYAPKIVPIGWAPVLRRIPKRPDEDIDVLLYGKPGPARYQAFHEVCKTGLKCVLVCGLYGASRDDLIGRSKIVLNVNVHHKSHVFEIVRVSYLLANGKAVVSDLFPDSVIDEDLRDAVAFCPPKSIAQTCVDLIKNDEARFALADRGRIAIERRDIRPILRNAIGQM